MNITWEGNGEMDLAEVAYVEFSIGHWCQFLTPEIIVIQIRLTGIYIKKKIWFVLFGRIWHIYKARVLLLNVVCHSKHYSLELSTIFRYLLKICPVLYLFEDYDYSNVLYIFFQFNLVSRDISHSCWLGRLQIGLTQEQSKEQDIVSTWYTLHKGLKKCFHSGEQTRWHIYLLSCPRSSDSSDKAISDGSTRIWSASCLETSYITYDSYMC
jgi:hypothetical protein